MSMLTFIFEQQLLHHHQQVMVVRQDTVRPDPVSTALSFPEVVLLAYLSASFILRSSLVVS
jgi:hypothetical protein